MRKKQNRIAVLRKKYNRLSASRKPQKSIDQQSQGSGFYINEISLIRNIFTTLEQEFAPERLVHLKSIHLKLGKLSNVEPVRMTSALHAVTSSENKFLNVSLVMEIIPVKVQCDDCGKFSVIENYSFNCRYCGVPANKIVEGEELLISKVEFVDEGL